MGWCRGQELHLSDDVYHPYTDDMTLERFTVPGSVLCISVRDTVQSSRTMKGEWMPQTASVVRLSGLSSVCYIRFVVRMPTLTLRHILCTQFDDTTA